MIMPDVTRELVQELDSRFRRPLISFFLRRVQDRAEAEDLTQQVFLRLIGSDATNNLEHADRFIFTVAANLLKDRAKSAARHYEVPTIDSELVEIVTFEAQESRSPERILSSRETLAEVFAVLDELGDRTKSIFVLFRLENMKQREIAELLGIGVSTVEKHVIKATLHLASKCGAML